MKPTLLFATLSLLFATPAAFAKSELEILRARCKEQEGQIRQLEEENMKLGGIHEARARTAPVEAAPAAVSKPAPAEAPAAGSALYTVKSGDSFGKIARKTGTTPEKLAKANGLKLTSFIRAGQQLKVPGKVAPVAATTAAVVSSAPAAPTPASTGKSYKIKQGETFSTISKKQGISVAALVAANPKVKPTALRPGQIISLGRPVSAPATVASSMPVQHAPAPIEKAPTPAPVAKAPAPVAKAPVSMGQTMPVSTATPKSAVPEFKPTPAAAPTPSSAPAVAPPETAAYTEAPSPSPEKKIQPVVIEGEMTYGEFAAKHGTDAERLNALNGLDLTKATVLAKGSELYVPAQP